MTNAPDLFDADLLARRRARAERLGGADFLHAAVAGEVSERLGEINRTFRASAVVGPRATLWAETLAGGGLPVPLAVADGELLALEEGAHDLVVHGLALHWANDPVGQLVQARRALVPDGLFIAALFGGETLVELRAALAEAEVATLGGLSPRVAPMGEIRDLGGLLQRAGFALPVADADRLTIRYGDPLRLLADLRGAGESNVLTARRRSFLARGTLMRALALYAERHGAADGRVPATFVYLTLTGWRPHESQPQPLKPGSARMRLEDALKPKP